MIDSTPSDALHRSHVTQDMLILIHIYMPRDIRRTAQAIHAYHCSIHVTTLRIDSNCATICLTLKYIHACHCHVYSIYPWVTNNITRNHEEPHQHPQLDNCSFTVRPRRCLMIIMMTVTVTRTVTVTVSTVSPSSLSALPALSAPSAPSAPSTP